MAVGSACTFFSLSLLQSVQRHCMSWMEQGVRWKDTRLCKTAQKGIECLRIPPIGNLRGYPVGMIQRLTAQATLK